MLSLKEISLPPALQALHELLNQGRVHDAQFGEDFKELQLKAKTEIEEMLD
jgi:hypothetical protein